MPAGQRKSTMRREIRTYIQRQIAQGVYRPGDRIVETQLAREMNVSQEQLDAMEVLLKKMDQAEDDASFAEMDIAFHGMIVDAADSPSLKRAWDNLRLVEWTSVSVAVTQESLPELAEQHWQIFRTLRSHAEQEAGAYMFLHIKHFGEELKRYVTETEQAEAVPQEREERRLS